MIDEKKVILRKATKSDSKAIRHLIHQVHINPLDLNWEHFLVALDGQGVFLGCGQIKVHRGGVHELASIAVVPEDRHRGIARKIIRQLIASTEEVLYLTCRARLEAFYRPFGFKRIYDQRALPRYFANIINLSKYLVKLNLIPEPIAIMQRKKINPEIIRDLFHDQPFLTG
jgi:N-acetylglutamate synthase-like GNAT family acetyltransferase